MAVLAGIFSAVYPGEVSHQDDLDLYHRLYNAQPRHLSSFEHQATPLMPGQRNSSNFRGWLQHRKLILGESGQRAA